MPHYNCIVNLIFVSGCRNCSQHLVSWRYCSAHFEPCRRSNTESSGRLRTGCPVHRHGNPPPPLLHATTLLIYMYLSVFYFMLCFSGRCNVIGASGTHARSSFDWRPVSLLAPTNRLRYLPHAILRHRPRGQCKHRNVDILCKYSG